MEYTKVMLAIVAALFVLIAGTMLCMYLSVRYVDRLNAKTMRLTDHDLLRRAYIMVFWVLMAGYVVLLALAADLYRLATT